MNITFDNYTYTDNVNDNQKFNGVGNSDYDDKKFNKEYFRSLIDNRQYTQAADYASRYNMNDKAKQFRWFNITEGLRQQGRATEQVYKNIPQGSPDRDALDFYSQIGIKGGMDKLLSVDDTTNKTANIYAKKLKGYIDDLGSNTDEHATTLELTFHAKHRKLIEQDGSEGTGFFGWLNDIIVPDNLDNNFEEFCKRANLTEEKLREYNIEPVKNSDGSTSIKFDKANALAANILLNAHAFQFRGPLPRVKAFNENGKLMKYSIKTNERTVLAFRNIRLLFESAKKINDKYFASYQKPKVMSSTIMLNRDDYINELRRKQSIGLLSTDQFNKDEEKYLTQQQHTIITGIGSGRYEMYSNIANDEMHDRTERYLNNTQREDIKNILSTLTPKELYDNTKIQIVKGVPGILIDIPADYITTNKDFIKDAKSNNDLLSNIKGQQVSVWIPNLLTENMSKQLENDTKYKAIKELDLMQDYGYSYDLKLGGDVKYDGNGLFNYTDNNGNTSKISYDEATNKINEDYIVKYGTMMLKYQFMNVNGSMKNNINEKGDTVNTGLAQYLQAALNYSIKGANEIYENTIYNENGEEVTNEMLTDYKLISALMINGKNKLDAESYKKVKSIQSMYEQYQKELMKLGITF